MNLPSFAQIAATLTTVAAAVLAGAVANFLGFPLPWLLGALLCSAGLSVSPVRFFGERPQLTQTVRNLAVPVIGVMIGAGITPDVARAMLGWWPSLLALIPVAVFLQLLNYFILRKVGGYDRPTAFFAASPGGLIEAVLLGEKEGGNAALMSFQQLCRIALSVISIPLIFQFTTGSAVGSAAGALIDAGKATRLSLLDAGVLIGCGAVGLVFGKRLRLPAAIMVGPMIISALVHITELSSAAVPSLIVTAAQIAIGTVIGLRFAGQNFQSLIRGMRLSIITVTISITVAACVALIIAGFGIAGWEAGFLAFAPGGLAEMGLIAISLGVSPIYVTTHHVVRIVVAVSLSRVLFRLLLRFSADR
ncbi:MAG: membrane AbrB-like protein [Akkermansiaceae bacterium]|jgi:membrane AbrB-like protein